MIEPGTLVDGRYLVEGELGRGGMAIVYRVRHAQLGTLAAMKLLTIPAVSVQKRLMHEGRVQAALQHPNIVSVSDVVIHDNAPALVMEYIRGPSLDDFLLRRRPTLAQADALADGVLAGVAAAHKHGLIHRDLKPGNIMLAPTDDGLIPKVTDFGLVKILEGDNSTTNTRSGVAMGTPAYMAPEQISDAKGVDQRADVFSLGAILYELLTAQRTFDDPDTFKVFSKIVGEDYVPLREVMPDVPDRMERAVRGALVADRDARIPTVERLRAVWRGEVDVDGTPLGGAESRDNPWDLSTLDEIVGFGAGGETAAESLRRSLAAPMPSTQRTVERPRPQPDPVAEGETLLPMAQLAEPAGAPPPAPASAAAAPPLPAPAQASAPTGRPRPLAFFAIAGVALFLTLFVGTVGAAGALGLFGGLGPTPTTVDPSPALDAPVPQPEPPPLDPEPQPTEPSPVQPPAEPAAAPSTPPTPAPSPAPETPAPPPVAPTPPPAVEPTPTPPEPPTPQPEPTAAPEPAPSSPPFVAVNAGGATVTFRTPHGRNVPQEQLEAGTAYEVLAIFSAGQPPMTVAHLTLEPGENVVIRCVVSAQKCTVTRR